MKTYSPLENLTNFINAGDYKVKLAENAVESVKGFWRTAKGIKWVLDKNSIDVVQARHILKTIEAPHWIFDALDEVVRQSSIVVEDIDAHLK